MPSYFLPGADTVPIRDATPDDIPALLRMEQQSETAAHWTLLAYQGLFAADASPRRTLVATGDSVAQEVCGFVVAHCLGDEWEIENLVVAPEQRRRGIGSELLGELLLDLQSKGVRASSLEVRESNVSATRLYEKHGFTPVGRRIGYYRNPPEDAVILRRVLHLCDNILEAE
jgi:ribosomal-protein-alanine N-acetyltransferase